MQLNLYDSVSHGFLNFKDISKDSGHAFSHSLLSMKETLMAHMAAVQPVVPAAVVEVATLEEDDGLQAEENQPFAGGEAVEDEA